MVPPRGPEPTAGAQPPEGADTAVAPTAGRALPVVHPVIPHLQGVITAVVQAAAAPTAVRAAAGPQEVPDTGAPVTGVRVAALQGVPEVSGVLLPLRGPRECVPQAARAGEITKIP